MVDQAKGEIALFVGGISEDRTVVKPSLDDIEIDGDPVPAPKVTESFSEYARAAADARRSWKSPLAVGLVYLWVKEIPAGIADAILEGASGFFRRIPRSTNVYATLYGRKRQPVPRLKASEIAVQLDDLGYLGGDRPNLADAIRLDLKALLGDEAPFKVLLVVTDGRDYDDVTGDKSADFTALADQIQKANVQLLVVSFPPSEADAEQSTRNLFDLDTSGTIRRQIEQPLGMQTTLESLGQAIADMRRMRLSIPWGWRSLGGTRRIRLNVTVDGKHRVIEAGEVTIPAGAKGWLMPLAILVALLTGVAGVVLFWRRRSRAAGEGDVDDDLSVVVAAHDLIQRGLSAPRVMVELTRSFPDAIASLVDLDPSLLADERFPVFRSRPGRRRFEELRALLSDRAGNESRLGSELAETLSQSVSGREPPDHVAGSITARVPEEQWSAFARMGLEQLAHALRVAGKHFPVLVSPHARSVALEIQAALRSEGRSMGKAVVVGWLVRAEGQQRRGETLRLPPGCAILGRAPGCDVRLDDDPQIAQQHAAIDQRDGTFFLRPLHGSVSVEAQPVRGRVPLSDGDTIEIGQNRLVFKCVSSGHAGSAA
jgi:hypothetical protein